VDRKTSTGIPSSVFCLSCIFIDLREVDDDENLIEGQTDNSHLEVLPANETKNSGVESNEAKAMRSGLSLAEDRGVAKSCKKSTL